MTTLTLVGTVLSTATVIAMSTITVNAYNSTIEMEAERSAPAMIKIIESPSLRTYQSSSFTVDVNKIVQDVVKYQSELECLAQNIYHEAMGESELGQRAVAYTTINRTKDERYPTSICSVVHQAVTDANGQPLRNKCQFSWYCDGKSDKIEDQEAYDNAIAVATIVINTYGNSFDPTMGATMYHSEDVKPHWQNAFSQTTEIENHIFYKVEG